MLFYCVFIVCTKSKKTKAMQKVFRFLLILYDSPSFFTMRDYPVGTHYSIYIKLRRLLLLFHALLFLTKCLSAEKSGTPQRAR